MPGIPPVYGLPGLGARQSATHKIVFRQFDWLSGLAAGKLIDGVNSRDPGNTPIYVLRAGMLMGKITASKLYAPSIIGVTGGALTGTGTSITVAAAVATELIRRQGTSGTLSLTGPTAANGVARTLAVTYSAVGATTITITAAGVNEVQTLNFANSPAGTFTLTIVDLNGLPTTTPPITYSATAATLVSNINTAVATAIGASLVVASGTLVTAIAMTFSGAGYAGLPQPLIQVGTNELTGGTVSVTRTTAGVNGAFVSGSFIGNNDGSQLPLTVIPDGYGIRVVDVDGITNLTVPFPEFPIAGVITGSQLVNWPADTGLQTWIETNLSTATAGKFVFDVAY